MRLSLGAHLAIGAVLIAACTDAPPNSPAGGTTPGAPTAVVASAGPDYNTLEIRWQREAEPGAYNVYCATTPGVTSQNATIRAQRDRAPVIIRGLESGRTYYCIVKEVNASGESPASAEVHQTASGNIAIQIYYPIADTVVGAQAAVAVRVTSRFELAGVVAAVNGQETALTYAQDAIPVPLQGTDPGWVGAVVLTSVPKGLVTFTVTATDTDGGVAQAVVAVTYDLPPRLTVTAPDSFTVARPGLHVVAACQDDESSCTVSVFQADGLGSPGMLLASAPGTLDQVIAVPNFATRLVFRGTDAEGQTATASRPVFLEPSSRLTEVATAQGPILDAEPGRILFIDQSTGRNILTIHDSLVQSDVAIFDAPPAPMDPPGSVPSLWGYLTPVGAVFVFDSTWQDYQHPGSTVYSWEQGVLHEYVGHDLMVNGRFALWSDNAYTTLTRRDVVAGDEFVVTPAPGWGGFALGPNGDAVYSAGLPYHEIFRARAGIVTQLTSDAVHNMEPRTDGALVAYTKYGCCGAQLAVYDATGEHAGPSGSVAGAVTNGWFAYTLPGPTGAGQTWVRSPGGQDVQVTRFASTSSLSALGPAGEVLFDNGSRRYLALPDYTTVPQDIGTTLGRTYFRSGKPFVIIGRSVFQVTP